MEPSYRLRTAARRLLRALPTSAALTMLLVGALAVSAGLAGATTTGCGDYSFGFTGTRLLNDGISDNAGPFAIDLPAGTYDIVMRGNDNHPWPDYQTEQTQEQWYFRLDNGYTSPPTPDVPSDETEVTMTIEGVELAAATSISVHHLGEGGINSVNVECVGFTVAATVAPPSTTGAPEIAGPPTPIEPEIAPPTPTTPPGEQTEAPPTTEVTPPAVQPVEPEVGGAIEVAEEPQLALTGRRSIGLAMVGTGLILLGLVMLAAERLHIFDERRPA